MQLKIINNENGITLKNCCGSKSTEMIISSDSFTINIGNNNVYKQTLDKIELSGELIDIFSEITEIFAEEQIEFNNKESNIKIDKSETLINSRLLQINSNTFYKISSQVINFYNV